MPKKKKSSSARKKTAKKINAVADRKKVSLKSSKAKPVKKATPAKTVKRSSSASATRSRKPTGSRKYSKGAQEQVRQEMRELKAGTAKSGRSGKKVTSRKQAIAIGLSEAREKGFKVPSKPKKKSKPKSKLKARK
jgi:hypothetical protein